jgi:hypothetical protein
MARQQEAAEVDARFFNDEVPNKARLYEIVTEKMDLYLPEYNLCSVEWLVQLVEEPPRKLVSSHSFLESYRLSRTSRCMGPEPNTTRVSEDQTSSSSSRTTT